MLILKIICSTLLGLFGLLFIISAIHQIHTIIRDKKNFGFTNNAGYNDPFNIALCIIVGLLILVSIILQFI